MDNGAVERLMDIILQMKINLAQVTETFHQQTYEIRQQLAAIFEEEKKALADCLSGIDDHLKECAIYIEDYQRLHASLCAMHEKLVQLGGAPSALPAALPTDQIDGVLSWRIQELRAQSKL